MDLSPLPAFVAKGVGVSSEFITTIKERCRMCYTCVRECPVKAIRITGARPR